MRKLMAGIAATAILLGGVVLGAATASAEGAAKATITALNAQQNSTYTAYKFAGFSNPKSDDGLKIKSIDMATTATGDFLDKITAAAKAAKNNTSVPDEYANNVAAWIATFSASELRSFSANVKDSLSKITNLADFNKGSASTADATAPTDKTISLSEEGWYLVVKAHTDGSDSVTDSVAVVASTIGNYETITFDLDDGQKNVTKLGQFNPKSENQPNKPNKYAYQKSDCNDGIISANPTSMDGKSVYAGTELCYVVQTNVPKAAAGYNTYPIVISDTASKGLTYTTGADNKVQIKAYWGKMNSQNADDKHEIDSSAYTVTSNPGENGSTNMVVTFNDVHAYAGNQLWIVYSATVNADAATADAVQVNNSATVQHNNGTQSEAAMTRQYLGGFNFLKYGVDGQEAKLAGAKFNVFEGDSTSGAPLTFTKVEGANGTWTYRYDPNSTITEVESDADGKVTIYGLKGHISTDGQTSSNGKYTLKETVAPDGYMDVESVKPVFTVVTELTANNGTVSSTTALQTTNNGLKLASQEANNGQIKVKNVKSITQLPLTGGAGIILFSVVAALLIAVAAIVMVRIRAVKHELQA